LRADRPHPEPLSPDIASQVFIRATKGTEMSDERGHQPTIFLVEEDDDTRPILKSNLQRYGYRVIVALDEEDALERMGGDGLRADLVMVDTVGVSTDKALNIGRRIRTYAKYNCHAPLVVMAEKYGADVEGTDVNVTGNDWITYLEDRDQLKNLLARLIPNAAA
jgi:DNA-binding response OmpR family regulator